MPRHSKNRKGSAPGTGRPISIVKFPLPMRTQRFDHARQNGFLSWRSRVGLCLVASVVLCFCCRSPLRQGADVPLTELSSGVDPLKNAFNKDMGKVRLMLLLDPT
jgi:hypothetical protein